MKECLKCGNYYKPKGEHAGRSQKYCSKKCWSNRVGKIKRKCLNCPNEFEVYKSRRKSYCSKSCRCEHHKVRFAGKNSHQWKGGLSLKNERKRMGGDIKRWKKRLLKLYKTCFVCDADKNLHVHHFFNLSPYPEFATKDWNGVVLCHSHHSEAHGRKIGKQATLESSGQTYDELKNGSR